MSLTAGVDLGGTKIAAALVDADHGIVGSHSSSTPTGGPAAVVAAIVEAVGSLPETPEAVGVGAPGPINDGVVVTAPNLAGWTEPVPLQAMLADALDLPVVVDNDANVGALGEWVAGAGRGAEALLGIWLGTGVGGGLVLNGRLYRGAFGGAGEFGHMVVHPDGALCGCGRRGCLEAYAGRASLERAVGIRTAAGQETAMYAIAEAKGKKRLTSAVWQQALADGDEVATALVDDAIEGLGIAVGSAVNLLDLDRIVVGGGLADRLGDDLTGRIQAAAEPHIIAPNPERTIVVAELGDDAGPIGAATLSRT